MIDDKQALFDKYMESFVKLTEEQKIREIVRKQKRMVMMLYEYANKSEIPYEFLKNVEMNDILESNASDKDYLEAMMVFSQNLEELMGVILLNK